MPDKSERTTPQRKPTAPPADWTTGPIENLFAPLEDGRTLHQGWSPQCEKEPSPVEEVWGVLKTTSIQAGEFQPEHNKRLPDTLEPRPLIEVKVGDILITCAGPRARCGIACLVRRTRKRLMMSGKMYRFRVDLKHHDARYVEAFLQTEQARQAIDKMKTGGSDSGLNLTHDRFRQLLVPVAPLPEQRLIVAEIEKQFTRLDAGMSALRRVQAHLKRYRAAVLKAACEGRLVPTEAETRKKFETGEQLLQRILKQRREKWTGKGTYKEPATPDAAVVPNLPDGWCSTSLDALIREPLRNGCTLKAAERNGNIRVFTLTAVTEGDFSARNTKTTSGDLNRFVEFWAEPGDIFVERGNTPELVGLARLYRGPSHFALIPDLLIRVRVSDLVLPEFIEVVMLSTPTRNYLRSRAQGIAGTMPKIDQNVVAQMPVTLPPLAEQERIVAEVERRLSVAEELSALVDSNLKRAISLRQSILQKAFAGELATQMQETPPANLLATAKTEPNQRPNRHFARALLSAEIVHQLHREPTFGRIKHQKVFHLCEHIAQIAEIQGQYHREAAGPLDNKLIYANEAELKKQKWYQEISRLSYGHIYRPLAKAGDHKKYLQRYWPDKLAIIEKLIKLMRTWSTDQCEIFCTAYAAWNDLILWGKEPTDKAILHEILDRWHNNKKRFTEERWRKAIDWMRKTGFVPEGFGKPTGKPE